MMDLDSVLNTPLDVVMTRRSVGKTAGTESVRERTGKCGKYYTCYVVIFLNFKV